ncbi:hypothetical protein [Pseudomonas oryzihabitans]|uniref:hypothetical protein n=1 Tax=Pseudomonas oryzihabitans TaxID=47885 RepID=UPI0028955901|nr:hypothetical protein [Pseudomonas oryzihabitans]MDT3722924.1 hypothetical protein [Pseudomonas oryzihabitans]
MQTENPLLGTWRSDKELTLRYWADVPAGPEHFMQLIAGKLGKLECSFTSDTSISRSEGSSSQRKYSITRLDESECEICIYGEEEGELDHQATYYFVSAEVYWVPVAKSREYFRKVIDTGGQPAMD